MARRTSRRKEDDVDAHIVARFHIDGGYAFGGCGDAKRAALVDRFVERLAGLRDFTSINATIDPRRAMRSISPAGVRMRRPTIDQPPRAQPPAGKALTLPSALLGGEARGRGGALQAFPFNSMARA